MRKMMFLLINAVISLSLNAQLTDAQKKLGESLDIVVGGTFGKPKVMPKMEKLALAEVSVNFKQVTTKAVQKVEKKAGFFGKSPGKAAQASVTAYLETTDGELSAADYQEVVDHFYGYFQKKLKEAGIDTVAWSAVTGSDYYKGADDDKADHEEEKAKGNTWVAYQAYGGKQLFNGKNGFAFLKSKSVSRMSDELGAALGFINVTVDFAYIDVDLNIQTGNAYKSANSSSNNTTVMNSETAVSPYMRVSDFYETLRFSLLHNDKVQMENVNVKMGIAAEMNFATEVVKDPSRAEKRNEFFRIGLVKKLESEPVVIATTREKYKAAAKRALERYAEAFVIKAQMVKN